jgi:hypothetical protein
LAFRQDGAPAIRAVILRQMRDRCHDGSRSHAKSGFSIDIIG